MNGTIFNPGQIVWTLEFDEEGSPCDICGSVVLCQTNGMVISTPKVNGSDDVRYLFLYHAEQTRRTGGTELYVNELKDCFASKEEAVVRVM